MFQKLRYLLLIPLCLVTFNLAYAQEASPTLEDVTETATATDTATATASPTVEATVEVTAEPPVELPEEESPLPDNTETPQDILRIIWAALVGGAATVGGSVFVTAAVGLLKMVIPASVLSGDMLKNMVSVITWIVYGLAIQFGFGTEARGIAAVLSPILVAATPLIGVLIGSSQLYLAARASNSPLWGYQRPQLK